MVVKNLDIVKKLDIEIVAPRCYFAKWSLQNETRCKGTAKNTRGRVVIDKKCVNFGG